MSEKLYERSKRRFYRDGQRPLWRKLLDYLIAALVLFALILLVARLDEARQVTRSGAPIVNDGDSLTMDGVRIRLWGIDAPEFNQSCTLQGKIYSCGQNSRDALRTLIKGKSVDCRGSERDKYDRLLAVCTVGMIEINAAMVESGWALSYGGYEVLEAKARKERKGIWAGEFERPRDWRQNPDHPAKPTDDFLAGLGDTLRRWLSSLLSRG